MAKTRNKRQSNGNGVEKTRVAKKQSRPKKHLTREEKVHNLFGKNMPTAVLFRKMHNLGPCSNSSVAVPKR